MMSVGREVTRIRIGGFLIEGITYIRGRLNQGMADTADTTEHNWRWKLGNSAWWPQQ